MSCLVGELSCFRQNILNFFIKTDKTKLTCKCSSLQALRKPVQKTSVHLELNSRRGPNLVRASSHVIQQFQWATGCGLTNDTGYPHDGCADKDSYPYDGRADKDSYPHDGRADKDSYPHDRHYQCIMFYNYGYRLASIN